jgi:carbamoyl-phosphate synthase (ammonia)
MPSVTSACMGIEPSAKQIDTLAAEYPAGTNYLYLTYHGSEHDVEPSNGGTSGLRKRLLTVSVRRLNLIGVVSVHAHSSNMGYQTTMINYNPETVSTDYDECDRLYFEELSRERVLDIYNRDKNDGVVVSVGGQIPNSLAIPLDKAGVKILELLPK